MNINSVKSFKALKSSLKCKWVILIIISAVCWKGEFLIGAIMSTPQNVSGNWFEVEIDVENTSVRIITHSIPSGTDSVVGIQIPISSSLLDENSAPLYAVETNGSWLFDNGFTTSHVGDITTGNLELRVLRLSGFKARENELVLILDLSEAFPNGASEEQLGSMILGGGCIVVLDDIM